MSFSCTIMILFFFSILVFYMAFLHFYKVLFILLVAVSDRPFLALGPMLLTTNQKISVLLLQVIQISIVTF